MIGICYLRENSYIVHLLMSVDCRVKCSSALSIDASFSLSSRMQPAPTLRQIQK